MADQAPKPLYNFLDKISGSWALSPQYTKFWAVLFSPSDGTRSNDTLAKRISDAITKSYSGDLHGYANLVSSKNNIYKSLYSEDALRVGIDGTRSTFILANKLTIPNDSVTINVSSTIGVEQAAGMSFGRYGQSAGNNTSSRKMKISFLDTNTDFVDYIIRPWIYAVACNGLIETEEIPSLKADIHCYFFSKSSPLATTTKNSKEITYYTNWAKAKPYRNAHYNSDDRTLLWDKHAKKQVMSSFSEDRPFFRQEIVFHNCVPTSAPGKTYNYGQFNENDIISDVDFSFDYYEIKPNENIPEQPNKRN